MGVKINQDGTTCTALLEGDIDHHTARDIREKIDGHLNKERPGLLCLDFAGIRFMDSSGIGLIMGRYKLIKILGGELKVTGASDSIKRIIRLSGLGALGVMKEER